jgi:hypothetical protein
MLETTQKSGDMLLILSNMLGCPRTKSLTVHVEQSIFFGNR